MASPSMLVTVSSCEFWGVSSALCAQATSICSHNLVFASVCALLQTDACTHKLLEVAAYATISSYCESSGKELVADLPICHCQFCLVLQLQLAASTSSLAMHTLPQRAGHKYNMFILLQTTYKGKSSFQTYADYLKWETFLQQQLQLFPEGSALRHGFQTCEHWKQIFMEIIGK